MSGHSALQDDEKNAPYGDDKKQVDVVSVPIYDQDGPVEFEEKQELRRGLQQRHIQMIALAGTIGTGLFLGSGRAISNGGPLGRSTSFSKVSGF